MRIACVRLPGHTTDLRVLIRGRRGPNLGSHGTERGFTVLTHHTCKRYFAAHTHGSSSRLSILGSNNCNPIGLRDGWETNGTTTTASGSRDEVPLEQIAMVEPIFDYQFRMILIGDSTVGKSSLLRYFTDGKFSELSDPTVGVDFYARLIQVRNGTRIKLQLWDTAGQERFRSICKSYYRNSVGAIVAYDITNRESFERVPTWISEAKHLIEPFRATFLIVACKSDLESERQVPMEEGFSYANALGIHFVETSARSGDNVEEAFQKITQEIYNRIQSGEYKPDHDFDGIKPGYSKNGSGGGGSARTLASLPEGTPEKSKCC